MNASAPGADGLMETRRHQHPVEGAGRQRTLIGRDEDIVVSAVVVDVDEDVELICRGVRPRFNVFTANTISRRLGSVGLGLANDWTPIARTSAEFVPASFGSSRPHA